MSWVWKKYIIELIKFREFVVIFSRSGMYRWQSYSLASPSVFFFWSHSFTVSPGHFFYIHDVKYTIKIVTKDIIFSGNGKKKYYTFFFNRVFSFVFLFWCWLCLCTSKMCDWVMKDVPTHHPHPSSPPIIVDGWYILIG